MAGLLDYLGFGGGSDPSSGLLASDPQAAAAALQADMRQQQLAGMAAGLLQSSGPSLMPHSIGQDLGNALVAGIQGRQNALKNAAAQQQLRSAMNSNALQDLTLKYYQDQNQPVGGAGTSVIAPGKGLAVASGMPAAQPMAQPAPQISPSAAPQGLLSSGVDPNGDPAILRAGNAGMPTAPAVAAPQAGLTAQPVGQPGPQAASPAPIMDRAALAQRASGMFRVPGLAGQAVDLLKLANQGMPEGAFYGQDGVLHAMPGYSNFVADKSTAETMGKNLQTRDANGNIVNQPGAVAANSQMAGGVEGAKSRATLPAELTKIGATGSQTRLSQQNQAGFEPATITVQTGTDADGKPIYTQLQTTKSALPGLTNNGPIQGVPQLSDQQKISATGSETRINQQNAAGYEMATVPMQTGTDSNGQPVFTSVQVPKSTLPELFKNGPIPGMQTLTPQQKAALEVWTTQQHPVTVRNDTGSIVIPGAGQPPPGLPVAPGAPSSGPSVPNTVLRVPRPGAAPSPDLPSAPSAPPMGGPSSTEANPVGAAPGIVLQGKTTAQVESEKKRADQMSNWQSAAVGNQNQLQMLASLADSASKFNTGKLSPDAVNAAGWIAATGADPSKLLGDPSNGEEFNKIASNFLTQQVSNLSSQPAHAAFGTIGAGMPTPDKRPETNHEITAQMTARLRWENDLAAEAAQKFPNGVPSTDFVSEFSKTHPTKDYLDQARIDVPPFAGMSGSTTKPISVMGDKPPANPLPNRWYSSKKFGATGRAMYLGDGKWQVPDGTE